MFNQYIWKLYLSSGGEKVVETFMNNLTSELTEQYAFFIQNLHKVYCPMNWLLDDEYKQFIDLCNYSPDNKQDLHDDDIMLFDDLIGAIKYENCYDNDAFSNFIQNMSYYTTILAINAPDTYVPYYYRYNFNVLIIIADTFEINLPKLPKKSDYDGRFMYYAELCDVLHEFRKEHDWSPFELFAFLYDFAPKYIGGISSYIITELPKPQSAYFIGGSKDDVFLSDNKSEITIWQCNPETKAGDMIVMYLRSPVSAVDSVWRSCSVGFIDPFFYYYRCTYICSPIKMKHINIEQMRSDKIIGSMPIVRKNMQGLNGVELKPSEYNHLLELGGSETIRLEYSAVSSDDEYSTEKEVENKVIKPLIEKLGYNENDYIQQLYLEIGNHNHALIPDFVLLPETKGTHTSAFAVVEAKRSITSAKELDDAKSQVRSYAKLLGTKYAAVISQEKVWVFSSKDDYSQDLFSWAVSGLSDNKLYELKKLIGKPIYKI